MLVRYRSEFRSSWACLSSEISFLFVIAAVRPNIAINSFFQVLRADRRIWDTTRGFSLMSRRELWHLHAMGQIMLLSSCCFLLSFDMNCLCLFLWWAAWPFLGEASLNGICGHGIVLRWGSWGCRKFVSILDPLKWPSQASFGTFFFRDWNKLKGDSWIYYLDSGNNQFWDHFPRLIFVQVSSRTSFQILFHLISHWHSLGCLEWIHSSLKYNMCRKTFTRSLFQEEGFEIWGVLHSWLLS